MVEWRLLSLQAGCSGEDVNLVDCAVGEIGGRGAWSGSIGLSLQFDDLHSIGEPYTGNEFRQLAVTVEAAPAFFGSLGELEDYSPRGLVRETAADQLLLPLQLPQRAAWLSNDERKNRTASGRI